MLFQQEKTWVPPSQLVIPKVAVYVNSPRQNTIGSLADRALQSKQQADVKLAQAVANAHEAAEEISGKKDAGSV